MSKRQVTIVGGAVEIWENMKRRPLKMVPQKQAIEIVNMKRSGSTKVAKTKHLSKQVIGVHLHEGQLVVAQAPD